MPQTRWRNALSISPASGAQFAVLPAQNATGNWVKIVQRIPVRLLLEPENGAPQLRAGMSAEVQIDTGRGRARYSHFFGAAPAQEPVASR